MTQNNIIAEAMFESHSAGEDWPLPSQAVASLNAENAYAIQHAFVAQQLHSDSIAGFKAGASAVPAQQMFGLDGPFCAVLLASGNRPSGASIVRSGFRSLLLETELCFRAGKPITQRIEDVGDLMQHIDGCFPAIELADTGGYGTAQFTGNDLIAGNGAAAAYMLGEMVACESFDLDRVPVAFSRGGQVLHEAMSGDLMGSQWHALAWLVNAIVDLGYEVQAGHLLLTGSLGRPHPGEPGRYLADYGELGQLAFEVV
ncbi:MAG: hypothetical protein VB948_02180 [Pseudomonadales bacterium]|jgi:2-keto-4-pentenoate hydratase